MKKLFILLSILFIANYLIVSADTVTQADLDLLKDTNILWFLDMYEDLSIERDIEVLKAIIIQVEPTVSENNAFKVANTLYKYSKKHELDVFWLLAMSHVESNFRTDLTSSAGAMGIMQIMPSTAKEYGIDKKDLFDLDTNIEVGTKYLKYLIKKYNSIRMATIAYNQGPGNVSRGTYNDKYYRKVENRHKKIEEIRESMK